MSKKEAINNNEMEPVDSYYGSASTGVTNYKAFAGYFKRIKDCPGGANSSLCWAVNGDGPEYSNLCSTSATDHFIDAKGRAWAFVALSATSTFDGLCVDTNGFSKPNVFGKDRFYFASVISSCNIVDTSSPNPASQDYGAYIGTCFVGLQSKLLPLNQDINFVTPVAYPSYCPTGKCYYKKWLLE